MHQQRTITSSTKHLACIAHSMSELLRSTMEQGTAATPLHAAYLECSAMQPSLSVTDFADLTSHLFIYSCFVARYYHNDTAPDTFQRQHITALLSYAHPLHRRCVEAVMNMEPFAASIDEIIFLLVAFDRQSIDQAFQDDPLTHFYERFLDCCDPRLRASHGIYYTSQPVISYIVRSIDYLLRSCFACRNGLADIDAPFSILDPACGTGVFVQAVLEHMHSIYQEQEQGELWLAHLSQYFLPRLTGIEVLMTPYLIAHLRLNLFLSGMDMRVSPFHLGNALSEPDIRQDAPDTIMIVLGNPPYAGHSANKEAWMLSLLDAYKEDWPELKKRAQAKWLCDDYVKFMRLAQWRIDRAGQGILAFITSHSYLDNPTFRGMRSSLMRSFDELFVLDLHGNSKKRELAPGATRDENVFAIQSGLAISIFIKKKDSAARSPTISHAQVWGSRADKLAWLAAHDLESTAWTRQHPRSPQYLFAPQETRYREEYEAGWSIPDIFRPNGDPAPGIITCHDEFAIAWSRDEMIEKVEWLLATCGEDEARQRYHLCAQKQWNYAAAKRALHACHWQQQLVPLLYRPFDTRWTVYNRHVAVHLRERVTRHLLVSENQNGRRNLALLIGKAGQVISGQGWDIVFCSRIITEFNLFRRGGNTIFPLYLAGDESKTQPRVNLAPAFIDDITARLGLQWIAEGQGDLQQTIGPEDIFSYIYALLHAPSYRTHYAAFLKRDFPRIPIPPNLTLLRALCHLGQQLIGLHLLECEIPLITRYPVSGTHHVEWVCYIPHGDDRQTGRVWINAAQYFENVPPAAWTLHIGGYHVCMKWLKDRRRRCLSEEEIIHFQKIVAALTETTRLMRAIDGVIEQAGGWPLS